MLSTPRAEMVMDVEKLDELLECSICLERLAEDSKVLPCQHTFCRQCLDHLHMTKNEIRCPECRILVTIPLDELPNNILLARLLEGMKIHGLKMDDKKSTPSGSSKSVGSWSSSKPNTPLQRVTPTPKQPWAKALYKYEGTEQGDLSFKKGDVILLRAAIDENWYQGEISGKIGVFPISYVQVAVPLTENLPKCKTLYHFQVTDSNDMNCLKFQKDQVLTVIRRVDDNWAEGMLGDRIGIFPISFVEMNDAVRRLMNRESKTVITKENDLNSERKISNLTPTPQSSTFSTTCDLPLNMPTSGYVVRRGQSMDATSSSPVTSFRRNKSMDATSQSPPQVVRRHQACDATSSKRLSLDVTSMMSSPPNLAHHRLSAEIPSSAFLLAMNESGSGSSTSSTGHSPLGTPMSCSLSPTTPSGHRLGPPPNEPPPPPPAVYSALYAYYPTKEDELELVKSEFYTVVEKCHDGWYKGASLKTGRVGVFPGNYVQFSSRSPKPMNPSCVTSQANDRSETHVMFPLPGMRPLQPARTSPQHQPGRVDVSDPPPRPAQPRPPQIVPRTSSHTDRSERSARRNSAPLDRIQLRPLPPTPSLRLDTLVPAPPPRPEEAPPTHARLKDLVGHMTTEITPPNVTMEMPSVPEQQKKKDKSSFMKRFKPNASKSSRHGPKIVTLAMENDGRVRIGHVQALPPAERSGASAKVKSVARDRYRCLVPYPPQTEIELELSLGDIVMVHKKRDDGWFKGTLERTGKTGLFPGSFVEPF